MKGWLVLVSLLCDASKQFLQLDVKVIQANRKKNRTKDIKTEALYSSSSYIILYLNSLLLVTYVHVYVRGCVYLCVTPTNPCTNYA